MRGLRRRKNKKDCPAGRAHFAWGDHFVVGIPVLGDDLLGASRWSADNDPDQREGRPAGQLLIAFWNER